MPFGVNPKLSNQEAVGEPDPLDPLERPLNVGRGHNFLEEAQATALPPLTDLDFDDDPLSCTVLNFHHRQLWERSASRVHESK